MRESQKKAQARYKEKMQLYTVAFYKKTEADIIYWIESQNCGKRQYLKKLIIEDMMRHLTDGSIERAE